MIDDPNPTDKPQQARDLEWQAGQSPRGVVGEFVHLLLHNKKWWLTPVVLALLIVGLLVVLGGSGAAPFIYTLF